MPTLKEIDSPRACKQDGQLCYGPGTLRNPNDKAKGEKSFELSISWGQNMVVKGERYTRSGITNLAKEAIKFRVFECWREHSTFKCFPIMKHERFSVGTPRDNPSILSVIENWHQLYKMFQTRVSVGLQINLGKSCQLLQSKWRLLVTPSTRTLQGKRLLLLEAFDMADWSVDFVSAIAGDASTDGWCVWTEALSSSTTGELEPSELARAISALTASVSLFSFASSGFSGSQDAWVFIGLFCCCYFIIWWWWQDGRILVSRTAFRDMSTSKLGHLLTDSLFEKTLPNSESKSKCPYTNNKQSRKKISFLKGSISLFHSKIKNDNKEATKVHERVKHGRSNLPLILVISNYCVIFEYGLFPIPSICPNLKSHLVSYCWIVTTSFKLEISSVF